MIQDEYDFILCSNCFNDSGLQIEACKIGRKVIGACPNCTTLNGHKLQNSDLEQLVVNFFWRGSFYRTEFGGASRIVSNPYRYNDSDVVFPPWLAPDAELLQQTLKVGLFHYGPPLWRVGEIEPLRELRSLKTRTRAARRLVKEFPTFMAGSEFSFFRLRTGIPEGLEGDANQYDSPPAEYLGTGRLDTPSKPVLYGSQNLEICFHECKITLPQETFIAHLCPKIPLKFLDMRAEIKNDGPTEFESKNLAIHYLFSADRVSYEITRTIAHAAENSGYDGIIYPSYFSSWKSDKIYNVAIFGRPVQDGRISVKCINRGFIQRASYEYTLGPLFE
jgi:hypothetical protein